MGWRFWLSFAAALVLCLTGIAGSGWLAARLMTKPPAQRFLDPNFEFQLPSGWHCVQEQTEWVCRSRASEQEAKEAAIILTKKWRGPSDSFEAYRQHLAMPRTIKDRDGKDLQSQIVAVERRWIGNHEWIYGAHVNSEIPNYVTHYYATITSHLAILVTASAHFSVIDKHAPGFQDLVRSLTVHQSRDGPAADRTAPTSILQSAEWRTTLRQCGVAPWLMGIAARLRSTKAR